MGLMEREVSKHVLLHCGWKVFIISHPKIDQS